jgi:predicted metal-dependent HD superfamily phosphohydrolase
MILYPPEIQTLLRSMYGEEGRAYHGMNHIKYLLAKARSWFTKTSDIQTYQLLQHAIWWHDASYSIFEKHGRNEMESAALFSELHTQGKFTLDVPGMSEDEAAGHVWQAIQTTARHLEDIDFNSDMWRHDTIGTRLTMLMMDVDLSGFAEDLDMVKHHSELVLKEYAPLGKSREALLEGRIAFLTTLLERKRMFYTDFFYEQCEKKARLNLQNSIEATQEELETLHTPEPESIFELPVYAPSEQLNRKRFTNHAGLKGWTIRGYNGSWRLHFDDGTSWHVSNIDNLTIED